MDDTVSLGRAPRGQRNDLLSLSSGACILGLTSILYELSGTSPSTGAFYRCAYAIIPLALLVVVQRRRVRAAPSGPWIVKASAAGAFLGLDLLLWHRSINDIGAGLATVLISLQVVFAAALGYIFLHQRIGKRLWRSIPVLLLGVVLVAGAVHPVNADATGAALAVLAAAAYAAYIVLMGAAARNADSSSAPMLVSTVATALVAGAAGMVDGSLDLTPPAAAQLWLLLLALDAQVIGWLLISHASRRLPAGSIAAGLVLQSAAALVFAAVLLAQLPTLVQACGAVLILAGVAATMAQKSDQPPTSNQAHTSNRTQATEHTPTKVTAL